MNHIAALLLVILFYMALLIALQIAAIFINQIERRKAMNIGMLWFDPDPNKSLAQRIEAAQDFYRSKYGRECNLVYVHPSMLADPAPEIEGIDLKGNRSVLPNHFWLGVKSDEKDLAEISA